MICLHGLDKNNCPICRIDTFSIPHKPLKITDLYNHELKPVSFHPPSQNFNNEDLANSLYPHKLLPIQHKLLNPISKPNFITEMPNFKNQLFLERLEELDLIKQKNFGISTKFDLANPELKIKKVLE